MTQHHFFQSFVHPSLPKLPPFKVFRHFAAAFHCPCGKSWERHPATCLASRDPIWSQLPRRFGSELLNFKWMVTGPNPIFIISRNKNTLSHQRCFTCLLGGVATNQSTPALCRVVESNSSCQALSFQCSWRTKSDEAAALKILSWAIH